MSRLDFAAIASSLNPETCVPEWLPDGRRNGSEWVARNPTRNDNSAGSFSVNLRTGKWADFATGQEGGDLVSLFAYIRHNNDNGAAARELTTRYGLTIGADERQAAANAAEKSDAPKIIMPIPSDAPEPTFDHYRYGQPTTVYPYYDAAGRAMLYICRFDPPDERKQILPRSWVEDKHGNRSWDFKGITGKNRRPIYGLDRLAAMPAVPVIVVEGEKAADAGQRIMGERAVVVAWLGGANTAGLANTKPLKGRKIILWPDADAQVYKDGHQRAGEIMDIHEQPGIHAMLEIAKGIGEDAEHLEMVGYKFGEREAGWDLADAEADGWDATRVLQHVQAHAATPWRIAGGVPAVQAQSLMPSIIDAPAAAAAPANDNQVPPAVTMDQPINPYGYPHLSDKGQPLNSIENLAHVLAEYGVRARYNEVRKSVEVTIPAKEFSADNRDNCALAEVTSLCARNRMPTTNIDAYIKLIADSARYSPVMDWIEAKPWDHTSRIQSLLDTVKTTGSVELKNTLIKRWMISAVAAASKQGGFSAHGVLVFTGAQGVGKTSWFRRLVPQELGLTLDGALLDPSNKDHILNAVSHWLVELGELDATFRKADIARLKSFITSSTDKLRRPYDRRESEYPRRTVFFASVNEDKYLVDDTGNRRWWTVPIASVDYTHTIDMQQVWAEVLHIFRAGEKPWLQPNEAAMLADKNADHEAVDPIHELITGTYEWGENLITTNKTATDVLIEIGVKNPNRAQATQASKILRVITGEEPRKSNGRKVFKVPPKRIGEEYNNDTNHWSK